MTRVEDRSITKIVRQRIGEKMYKALSPGAINVRANDLQSAIQSARIGGFGGVEFNPSEIADLIEGHGANFVRDMFEKSGIRPAGFGLPLDWRGDEEAWKKGLEALPRLAQAASAIDGGRTMTWIMPCSNDREREANFDFHVSRLKPAMHILADHGCRFGLEFIGPLTLYRSQKFPFIRKMGEMLTLASALGEGAGLLLDCWHWHTTESTTQELLELKPEQIVYVHVNEAPAGVSMEAYVDNKRGLPGSTGVIDIKGFLQSLEKIGYDGPVTPEPFENSLSELPSDEDRLKSVGESMEKIFSIAGVHPH